MDILIRAVEVAYDQLKAYYDYVLARDEITFEEYVNLDARYFLLVTAIRTCDVRDSAILNGFLTPARVKVLQDTRELLDDCQQQSAVQDALYR